MTAKPSINKDIKNRKTIRGTLYSCGAGDGPGADTGFYMGGKRSVFGKNIVNSRAKREKFTFPRPPSKKLYAAQRRIFI